MGDAVRKMTLTEEIENLEVPEGVRERLIKKLCDERLEEQCKFDEKMMKYEHKLEEQDRAILKMKEQNLALKDACFWLADALKNER